MISYALLAGQPAQIFTSTMSTAVRTYLTTGPTDLQRSIDGHSALVRERLYLDPLSGPLFLFRNRSGDHLKIPTNGCIRFPTQTSSPSINQDRLHLACYWWMMCSSRALEIFLVQLLCCLRMLR